MVEEDTQECHLIYAERVGGRQLRVSAPMWRIIRQAEESRSAEHGPLCGLSLSPYVRPGDGNWFNFFCE